MSNEYIKNDVDMIVEALRDVLHELHDRGASDQQIKVAVKEAMYIVMSPKDRVRVTTGNEWWRTNDDLPFC